MTKCFECHGIFDFAAYITSDFAKTIVGLALYTPVCPWCGEPLYKRKEKPLEKTKEAPQT